MRERLIRAYQILTEMERLLRVGEWGNVVKQLRELNELFEKDLTAYIKQLLTETTQIPLDNSRSLVEGIAKLSDYANALHHSVISKGQDRGGIMPVYHGGKEDAYMVYALSTSIVNLLTKKFNQGSHES